MPCAFQWLLHSFQIRLRCQLTRGGGLSRRTKAEQEALKQCNFSKLIQLVDSTNKGGSKNSKSAAKTDKRQASLTKIFKQMFQLFFSYIYSDWWQYWDAFQICFHHINTSEIGRLHLMVIPSWPESLEFSAGHGRRGYKPGTSCIGKVKNQANSTFWSLAAETPVHLADETCERHRFTGKVYWKFGHLRGDGENQSCLQQGHVSGCQWCAMPMRYWYMPQLVCGQFHSCKMPPGLWLQAMATGLSLMVTAGKNMENRIETSQKQELWSLAMHSNATSSHPPDWSDWTHLFFLSCPFTNIFEASNDSRPDDWCVGWSCFVCLHLVWI